MNDSISVSQKTTTTNFKTLTKRDLTLMTKRKAINIFKGVYSESEPYLRNRLENVKVEMISGYQREEILAFIKTLVEKSEPLPNNVAKVLNESKMRKLKKLASDTKLIDVNRKYKRDELKEILQETYISRPYLYLNQPEFRELAVKAPPRKERILFTTPIVQYDYEEKIEDKKEEDNNDEEKKEIIDHRKTSNLLKYQTIVKHFIENKPIKDIVKELNVSHSHIQKWISKFSRYGDVNLKVKGKGRKRVIDQNMKEFIEAEYIYEPALETRELVQNINDKFNTHIHKQTVYKFLKKMGKFVRPKEKGVLNANHKKRRLLYCTKMSSKSFKNIIFTDESMIELFRNKRKVFRLKGRQAIRRYSSKKTKVMVWGAISEKGKIDFKIIPPGTMVDSEYYINQILPSFIEAANLKHKKWTLMQDNAGAHVSEDTLNFLKEQGIKYLSHPANSPDLNPIELVWNLLKRKIEAMQPKGIHDLVLYAQKAWEALDDNTIKCCIKGLRKVMRNVIDSNGDNIFKIKPKRNERVDYKEADHSDDKKNDPNFYSCCDLLKQKRKLISKYKRLIKSNDNSSEMSK